ncbi:hypothetical protein HAX54_034972 [Datura stramonium]|uniref:Uncharacterized protein n=1 Tax=Datura stramonium TaxID=4076 RepID=A0ABS8VHM9_DATST|nr:hypothetical protein [Datura stramonium]
MLSWRPGRPSCNSNFKPLSRLNANSWRVNANVGEGTSCAPCSQGIGHQAQGESSALLAHPVVPETEEVERDPVFYLLLKKQLETPSSPTWLYSWGHGKGDPIADIDSNITRIIDNEIF